MKPEPADDHARLWALYELDRPVTEEAFVDAFSRHLEYTVGKYKLDTTDRDAFQALALTVRERLIDRWNEIQELYRERRAKKVYYLSMEFLLGRLLESVLFNTGTLSLSQQSLGELGFRLDSVRREEPDAGLGNGGLGRLAACFLESLATLDLPAQGCSLRYEFGMFRQEIVDGRQHEAPDNWLSRGNPWELMRADRVYPIRYYGRVEGDPNSDKPVNWVPGETVLAMAYDVLIPGFNTRTVANLRLFRARASEEFQLDYFNHGDYVRACEEKDRSETISKVLYPSDSVIAGRELRLKQEYLLVSATLQDALRSFLDEETDLRRLPDRAAFQLNDTHPALAVAELMRLLIDEHHLSWSLAWDLTTRSLAYTNHTVMPEALESWEVDLVGRLLPRHLGIIYRINWEFIQDLERRGFSGDEIRRMSLVDEHGARRLRMAHLAVVGSHAVNGVSALHTMILKKELFADFNRLWPRKILNQTNGVTHRRWLGAANPQLTTVIAKRIGRDFLAEAERLSDLDSLIDDEELQSEWRAARLENKRRLAEIIRADCGVEVDPQSLFDVHVKRIHEYKRQLLNVLRVLADYVSIKADPGRHYLPRTVLFAGKAAPAYTRAKSIIHLIHRVAALVGEDRDVGGRLRVVFLPDYRVSLAERIIPAADLSEQISTAGTEASGTGNMKFMLNGAPTIGTLDGANVEMRDAVGEESFFLFGHTVEQLQALRRDYRPNEWVARDPLLAAVLDLARAGLPGARGLFDDLLDPLFESDPYFVLADFRLYLEAQSRIADVFAEPRRYYAMSIRNTARSGRFSSDRTVRGYAEQIWGLAPVRPRPPRIHAL